MLDKARLLALLVMVLASIFMVGCDDDDDDDDVQSAQLRVLHASPDAPNVDVLVNGEVVLSNVPFQAASGFLTVDAGETQVQVNAAGTDTTVIDETLTLAPESASTVIATNFLDAIGALAIADDRTAPADGQVKLRVIHAAPSVGNVDVYVEANSTPADQPSTAPVVSNVPFNGVGSYLEVPAGEYQIFITGTGSLQPAYDSGVVTLSAGSILDAVAADDAETTVTVLALTGDDANPVLKLANTVSDDTPPPAPETFQLQLLHAADFEGGIEAIDDAPRFSAILAALEAEYPTSTLKLLSGDNFIPGPFFSASADDSLEPIVGTAAQGVGDIAIANAMGFQASAFGNHEFDLGTDAVEGLIEPDDAYPGAQFPYLSANLDFSANGDLGNLVVPAGQAPQSNTIAPSVIITVDGEQIGVFGAQTTALASITSLGTVDVQPSDNATNAELAAQLQPTVDALLDQGVDKVIMLGHMQQISIELELAELLSGVDIIVGGGSNTIFADETDRLREGDAERDIRDYPVVRTSASGEPVLVVNTDGNYRYVGRLVVEFDENGVILTDTVDSAESGAFAADDLGVANLAATPDATVQQIVDAIADVIVEKDSNVFGETDVFLEGRRQEVRTEETNLGNLTADANLWTAQQCDADTVISLKNGGGIRAPIGTVGAPTGGTGEAEFLPPAANPLSGKAEGEISQLDIENSLRFNNGLTLLTVTAEELIAVLEHAIEESEAGATPGRFPQLSGVRFSFNPPAGETPAELVNVAVFDGDQLVDVVLADGELQGDAGRTFRLVTLNFLADGGDGFPLTDAELSNPNRFDLAGDACAGAGVAAFADPGSEQDALAEYLNAFFSETPFAEAETPPEEDEGIQNLTIRDTDTVIPDVSLTSNVRVLHASPDAPNVDVLVDDEVVLADVPYQAASGFLEVPLSYNLKVNVAGTDTTVIESDIAVDFDIALTVAAIDFVDGIRPLVLEDDRSAPAEGNVKVRVIHTAPSFPPVDVFVTAAGADRGAPVLTGVPFEAFSDYLEVPAGDYVIEVAASESGDIVYSSGTVTLPAGGIFDVFATDEPGETTDLTLLALTGDSAEPVLELGNQLVVEAAFTLQLLHAADFEGGVEAINDAPRFSAVLGALEAEYPNTTLKLLSGDNYIPGPFFSASSDDSLEPILGENGAGFGDIEIVNAMGFQASSLGNHEFDLGTDALEGLIEPDDAYPGALFPYLSANLDFSANGDLANLVVEPGQAPQPNTIADSVIIDVNGEQFGVFGATTTALASITSLGNVSVLPEDGASNADLAAQLQPTVDALIAQGVDKIIMLGHMQQIAIELELAELLSGVDIVIGGGSNTIFADATDRLREGDAERDIRDYPEIRTSASGEPVLVVNTDGNYRYVGRLVVGFDEQGRVIPATVDASESGAFAADDQGVADLGDPAENARVAEIAEALAEVIIEKDGNTFGLTEVFLEGRRQEVRTEETNLGNLTAEANLWAAQRCEPGTLISLKNGGGIRAPIGVVGAPTGGTGEPEFLPPQANPLAGKLEGEISQLDIENSLRFNNGLTLLSVTAAELLAIIEHGVSATEPGATPGQFPQVAGIRFSFDPEATPGDRVQSLAVVDGDGNRLDVVVEDGELVGNMDRTFRLVTLSFLADGGDGYPLTEADLSAPNRFDLAAEACADAGIAAFSDPGREQDALAEFVNTFFASEPFAEAETAPADDETIQNLVEREEDTAIPPEPALAGLRVLHASPDAPNVDVLVNDVVALGDVPFKAASGFLDVIAGDTNIKVNAAGTQLTVIEAELPLAEGSNTTVAAINFLESIEPLVLEDDRSAPAEGNVKVRVVHAAPSFGAVDVYVTPAGAERGAPTLAGVPFTAFSDYLEVPAGTYTIEVAAAGSEDIAYASGEVALAAGGILDVFAADDPQEPGVDLTLLVLTGDSANPVLELPNQAGVTAGFGLQLLHVADIDGKGPLEDVRNFSALVDEFQGTFPDNTVILSSGDNWIPGVSYNSAGQPGLADVLGVPGRGRAHVAFLNAMGFQAATVGNHELDEGPDAFVDIIQPETDGEATWPGAQFPYLSTNLVFENDEDTAPLVVDNGQSAGSIPGQLADTATLQVAGKIVGLVGAAAPTLGSITDTGSLGILPVDSDNILALAGEIQTAVDSLTESGVDVVILLAHMQQIAIEKELAELLTGVDIIVAGGSNTRLGDTNDRLYPGDEAFADTYPLMFQSRADEPVLVVNVDGDFKYLGRLVVNFDFNGVIIEESLDTFVNGVYASDDDSLAAVGLSSEDANAEVVAVADALQAVIDELAANALGQTSVYIQGEREFVRTEETNAGNLTADANLWLGQQADPSAVLSLKNGGGIRAPIGQIVVPPGSTDPADTERLPKEDGLINQLDIETTLRFNNEVVLLTVTAAELADIVEHAVAGTEPGATPGQFPQVGGLRFSFDPTREARVQNDTNQADPSIAGDRLRSLAIVDDSGAVIDQVVADGAVVGDVNRTFRMVTLGFLARCIDNPVQDCGDFYPFRGLAAPNLVNLATEGTTDPGATDFAAPGTEQDALAEYLRAFFAESPFEAEETPAEEDLRIQNLSVRDDAVVSLPKGAVTLEVLGSFTENAIYDEGAAEIVTYDPGTQNLFVINSDAGTVDVLSLADPANPALLQSLDGAEIDAADPDFVRGDFNSVAVQNGIVALAVAADDEQTPGRAAFYDASTFAFLGLVEVGALPDMIVFTPDGTKVLTANEGEPNDEYTVDPEGSVSIIDISAGVAAATVTTAGFNGVAIPDEVRIFGPGATPAQDLEPEYIAVSSDSTTAYVALQENNALAIVDLTTDSVAAVLPLGVKDHSLAGNGFDAANDGEITIVNHNTLGFFQPDAIDAYGVDVTYLVTANEGDTRDYDNFSEEEDLGNLPEWDGDPQTEELLSTTAPGVPADLDGNGVADQFSIGGRSFSVWNGLDGSLLFDSGDDFERITAHLDQFGATGFALSEAFNFNDDNDETERDGRSDNKGPEPEGVVVGTINGRSYAFIGLERVGGIMVYDVTNPRLPRFTDYFNNRDFTVSVNDIDDGLLPAAAAGDLGPEGIAFIPANDSPIGEPLLAVGNEVSGTTTIYRINVQ